MKPSIPPHVAYPALHASRQEHCRASDAHGTAGLVISAILGGLLLAAIGLVVIFLAFGHSSP